jgi:RimJ/RimL family protein N-acetyltransferase
MDLVPYSDGDLALTEAIETDPRMMGHLGGPISAAEAPEVHRKRLETSDGWWFRIVPEPGGPPAGQIGIWESEWDGEPIHELGWMVLPDLQGQGIATRALEEVLRRARSEERFVRLHAFPGVENSASNALCERFGFELTEQRDVDFRDRSLRCNHWELRVA